MTTERRTPERRRTLRRSADVDLHALLREHFDEARERDRAISALNRAVFTTNKDGDEIPVTAHILDKLDSVETKQNYMLGGLAVISVIVPILVNLLSR